MSSKTGKGKKKVGIPKDRIDHQIRTSFTESMKGAIEIHVIHLQAEGIELDVDKTVFLTISYGNEIVGLVEEIIIPTNGLANIDYHCYLEIAELDNQLMDAFIATPFFFSLAEGGEQGGISFKKLEETRTRVSHMSSVQKDHLKVLGQGNMDLLSLILEEGACEKTVVLEPPGYQDSLFFTRSASENPRLLVRLTDVKMSFSKVPLNNIMWLSVESIFSPNNTIFNHDAEYTIVFPIPLEEFKCELSTSSDSESLEDILKPGGKNVLDTTKFGKPNETIEHLTADFNGSDDIQTDNQSVDSNETNDSFSNSNILTVSEYSKSTNDQGYLTFDATKPKKAVKKGRKSENIKSASRQMEITERVSQFTLIEFPNGLWKEEPELDLRKKWVALASVIGAPAMHSQRVNETSHGLLSKFDVNLEKKMKSESEPRIMWNMVRPFWLSEMDQQNIIKKIYKHGVWPVELVVVSAVSEHKHNRDGGGRNSPETKDKKLLKTKKTVSKSYIAWLDLSTLLFPGSTQLRVVGQLQYFNKEEGEFLWGLNSTIVSKPAEHNQTNSGADLGNEYQQLRRRKERSDTRFDSSKQKQQIRGSKKKLSELQNTDTESIDSRINSPTRDSQSSVSSEKIQKQISNPKNVSFVNRLKNDYRALKCKYEKLKSEIQNSKYADEFQFEDSDDETDKSSTQKAIEIILDEFNEKELHKLLKAKNALDAWTILAHKKLLMKRYTLASLRKKLKEELVLHESEKLYNEDHEPTFIVFEIQLLKPLIPKKDIKTFEKEIKDILPPRTVKKQPSRSRYNSADFTSCVSDVITMITHEFEDFAIFPEATSGYGFYDHLVRSRAHQNITDKLRRGITCYITDVICSPLEGVDVMDPQAKDFIGWLYCHLMDEMQTTVNKFILSPDLSTPETMEGDGANISANDLMLFATEAAEERDYDRAKQYICKLLEGEGLRNPDYWSCYAVIALRLGDYPKAIECLREALAIDIRHKESLLMYAVLLTMGGMFEEAENFFCALVEFYPLCAECWFVFHKFFLLVEKSVGADSALILGVKCIENMACDQYKPRQLSWDNSFLPDRNSVHLNTAIYLLSFNLYEMAEVCLAQELEEKGRKSPEFNYYLAVCHHIQGRYEDSTLHLARYVVSETGIHPDSKIWMILGHNKWQMGRKKEAVRLYLEACSSDDTPAAGHMMYIRCGYYFLECNKPELAKQMFYRAVENIGTPMGWLGLGIALYMLGNYDDAELALEEANTLDNRQAVVWAYLGLICLQKNKLNHFQQCFNEAQRYGLNDQTITNNMCALAARLTSSDEYK